jgi:transcriptional regulator with XRE-family HTH domain
LKDAPASLSAEVVAFVEELRFGHAKAGLSLGELAGLMYSSKASVSRWLSGRAVPTEDQARLWTRVCGTDEATMLTLWRATATTHPPRTVPPLAVPAPAPVVPERSVQGIRWRLTAAAAVLVVLAVTAVALTQRKRDPPPTEAGSGPCEPHATKVEAPPRADTTFDITVTVLCQPPAGRVYWLFIRGDNIGEHATTNYYPNARIEPAPGTHVVQNFVKPTDADGDRFYLVVSVEQQISDTLTDKREFVNRLPSTGEVVSASVRTTIAHPTVAAT